jgi:hypothetical protein
MGGAAPGLGFLLGGWLAAGLAGLMIGWLQRKQGIGTYRFSLGRMGFHGLGVLMTAVLWHILLVWESPSEKGMRPDEHLFLLGFMIFMSVLPWFTAGWGVWVIIAGPAQSRR